MKGRVGHSIPRCPLVIAAALVLVMGGCQRAKPARVVAPPPGSPRVETPAIAQVAVGTATALAAPAYPAPSDLTPIPPAGAASPAAYPAAALPPTPAATDAPTAAPSPLPTESPTAAPTATVAAQEVQPEATPTVPAGTPVPPEVVYRVKAGDSLGSIAVLHNTTSAAIMARNGLRDPSLIRVGQTLFIPSTTPETLPTGTSVRHTVGAGESLADIALAYRTTVEAILARNPSLSDPQRLAAGLVLEVLVGSETAGRTHVVRAGESLSEIAERYGLTTQALARANGLTDPSLIRVGQTLIVP